MRRDVVREKDDEEGPRRFCIEVGLGSRSPHGLRPLVLGVSSHLAAAELADVRVERERDAGWVGWRSVVGLVRSRFMRYEEGIVSCGAHCGRWPLEGSVQVLCTERGCCGSVHRGNVSAAARDTAGEDTDDVGGGDGYVSTKSPFKSDGLV